MKLNLFTKNNCPYCEQLVVPENLIINITNIDEGYDGYLPPGLPVLQLGDGLNLEGPQVINTILAAIADDNNKR